MSTESSTSTTAESSDAIVPKRAHGVSGYVFPSLAIAVSAVFMVQSVGLGFGSLQTPGAGLWPFVIAIVTILLAVAQSIAPGGSTGSTDDSSRTGGKPHARAFLLGALVLFYAVLVESVGYLLLTAAMLFIASLFVARARWWSAAVTSLAATGVVYMVFSTFLGIPLPAWPAF